MKMIICILMAIALVSFAYASDLSDFPEMFIDNNSLDALIVVGDKAPSSDVLLQSKLVVFFGEKLNKPIHGRAKLASEISDLNQSLISIGNPCHNNLSARILSFPQPCESFVAKNRAVIKLIEYDGYSHIVVAGFNEEAAKEAVNVLIDYGKYGLDGTEFVMEAEKEAAEEDRGKNIAINQEERLNIGLEKERMAEELNNKIQNNGITKEADLEVEAEVKIEEGSESDYAEKPLQPEEKPNIIKRIISWVISLFG